MHVQILKPQNLWLVVNYIQTELSLTGQTPLFNLWKYIFHILQLKEAILFVHLGNVRQKTSLFQASCDRNLTALRDDLATDLFELEEEYYSSSYKWTHLMNEYWTCFNDPDQDRNIPEKLQQIAKIHKIRNLLPVDQNNLLLCKDASNPTETKSNSLVFSEMRKGILGLD